MMTRQYSCVSLDEQYDDDIDDNNGYNLGQK